MSDIMQQVVDLLREKGGMTESEILAAIERFRKEEEDKMKSKEEPRLVYNDDKVAVVFPNGFSVIFGRFGDIQWTYDGKVLDENTTTPIVSQHIIESCLKYIVNLHIVEKEKLYDLWVTARIQTLDKVKHRYMNKNQKRAFVSGMILGKKEAGC